MGRCCESIRRQGGLTRRCSFAAAATCGGNATAQRRVFKCGRDLPSADGRKSPRGDQCLPELTRGPCVSTSSPPRVACSARRSQDCANVSQRACRARPPPLSPCPSSLARCCGKCCWDSCDAPRYAAWVQTQPSNLGKLVTSAHSGRKAFMSARRLTVQAPPPNSAESAGLPPARVQRRSDLYGPDRGPRLHCQAGRGGYVQPPCPMPAPPPRTSWSFTAPTCISM